MEHFQIASTCGASMPSYERSQPIPVKQTLADSCWAAVLQSWSYADIRIHDENGYLHEMDLVKLYGVGKTGGMPPATQWPTVCQRFGLSYTPVRAEDIWDYLREKLPGGYVFCALRRPPGSHAVLIYKFNEETATVSFMDPDGGRIREEAGPFFDARGPLLLSSYGIGYRGP